MFKKTLIFICHIFFLLSSCNVDNKESYISDFNNFVTKTSENYKSYKNADWADVDKTFDNFQNERYKKWENEFTPEEYANVHVLIGKYQAIKIKSGLFNLKKGVNSIINQAGSLIKEVASDSTLLK